jgi:hypothetical protein
MDVIDDFAGEAEEEVYRYNKWLELRSAFTTMSRAWFHEVVLTLDERTLELKELKNFAGFVRFQVALIPDDH